MNLFFITLFFKLLTANDSGTITIIVDLVEKCAKLEAQMEIMQKQEM